MILGALLIVLFYAFIEFGLFGFGEPANIGAGFMPLIGGFIILLGLVSFFHRRSEDRRREEDDL